MVILKSFRKSQHVKKKRWKFGAFDIETWGLDATKFAFGVVVWNEQLSCGELHMKKQVFFDKEEMFNFMISRKFKGYIWFAHNINYDLSGLLGNYLLKENFNVLLGNGRVINGTYQKEYGNGKNYKIYFRDSMNFFNVKLETLGKSLGYNKLETPDKFIVGKETEITEEDINYCIRDTEIVLKAVNSFSDMLYNLWGVNMATTIAGTALRVFRTAYLEEDLKVSDYDKFFRNSYFGGRTEVIEGRKEYVYPVYYHDFNSLYPSVMIDSEYPHPEYLIYLRYGTIQNIMEFEGVSEVIIEVPDMKYPPLPYKHNGKLIFPIGKFSGWYNHNELRMAIKYGVKILEIKRQIYSEKTIKPFKNYIRDLYNMRLEAKKFKDKTKNLYTKLLMNSLYGKFAQRIEKRVFGVIYEIPKEIEKEYNKDPKAWIFEPIRDTNFGYWKKVDENKKLILEDSKHDIISFASYTTSYARMKLFEAVQEVYRKSGEVYYTDTDSILTNIFIEDSKELGKLKVEKIGILKAYAPKVYEFWETDKEEVLKQVKRDKILEVISGFKYENKMKGIPAKYRQEGFKNEYIITKIIKPKEALRRNIKAGKPIQIVKKLNFEDEKRIWNGRTSKPIDITDEYYRKKLENDINRELLEYKKTIGSSDRGIFELQDGTFRRYNSDRIVPDWALDFKKKMGRLPNLKEAKELISSYLIWLEKMSEEDEE